MAFTLIHIGAVTLLNKGVIVVKIIDVQVNGLIAHSPHEKIVCGNTDYIINFQFSEEWNNHPVKTARFVWNNQYEDVIFTGNECSVPKITNAITCAVGVYAGDLITTTPAFIGCLKSIICEEGTPAEPSSDVYAQIMRLMEETKTLAQSVREDADAGEFKGDPGADGLTPYIKEGNWWIGDDDTGVPAANPENLVERLTSTENNLVYVERSRGRGIVGYKLHQSPVANGIPERDANGNINVPETPSHDTSAVAKKYVDNITGDIETALDSIIAMQESLIGGET